MWHLLEHFFDQNLVLKLVTLWGWLAVVLMLASIFLS
jgi:hypothetical protein